MTERYKNDKTYAALVNAIWYNVGADATKTIVDKFREFNQDESSHYFSTEDIDKDWYFDNVNSENPTSLVWDSKSSNSIDYTN